MAKDLSHKKNLDLPAYKKLAELSEEELAERHELIDFCRTLCRAVLQNSYYSPDHPMARKVAEEPYGLLQHLGRKWDEFTFVLAAWSDDKSVALEGVFNEAISLEELIGGTAGEHFSAKMHTFCQRNRLISFAIKNLIGDDEFHRFIAVFVERHVDMEAQRLVEEFEGTGRGPKFTEQLLDANVINVSVVLEEDLSTAKRRLPWRVKIALARLGKDLRNIPLYSQATAVELKAAKLRLLRDIMRPLRRGSYMRQLFLNLDLISESVDEFEGVDLEPDLMAALPFDRLLVLARSLLAEQERLSRPQMDDTQAVREDLPEVLARLLAHVGEELCHVQDLEGSTELLRELFEQKMITIDKLPRRMQEQIRMDRWTASFLVDANGFLQLFDAIEDPRVYVQQLPNVVAIFPNLIRVRKYGEAEKIIDMLHRHHTEEGGFHGRTVMVDEALAKLDNKEVYKHLSRAMINESEDVRDILRRLFVEMGPASIPPLVRVLDHSTRADVCNDAAMALVQLGSRGLEHIKEVLGDRHVKRNTARYLLKVLGELGDGDSTDVLYQYTRHPHGAVRDAALESIVRIHGLKAEPLLVRALHDTDETLVCRVIRFLVRLRSEHKAFMFRLLQFIGAVNVDGHDQVEVPMNVEVSAIQALATMGNLELGDLGTLEEQLIKRLDAYQSSRVMGILNRGRTSDNDIVRFALCDALVTVGTELSIERLGQTSVEPSPRVRERMEQSVIKLRRRMSGGTPAEA